MKILTDQSLSEAVKLCQENERYRVLIVTQYAEDHDHILDKLYQVSADITRCLGHPWAKFPNGSVIDLVSVAANMRGRKANLVLCQTEVYNNYDEIKHMLPAIEITNRNFKFFQGEVQPWK